MNCDVFKLLNTYGIEIYEEDLEEKYTILFITDCISFCDFLKKERYEIFPL